VPPFADQTRPSPTATFIRDVVHRALSPALSATTLQWHDSWEPLLAIAIRGRLAPLFGHSIQTGALTAPSWVGGALVPLWKYQRARNQRLIAEALAIQDAMCLRGVQPTFRKGLGIEDAYPAIGTRPYSDIDIYLGNDELDQARAALTSLGFVEGSRIARNGEIEPLPRSERAYLKVSGAPLPFVRRAMVASSPIGVMVDLSTELAQLPGYAIRPAPGDAGVTRLSAGGLRVWSGSVQFLEATLNLYLAQMSEHYVRRLRHQRVTVFTDLVVALEAAGDARRLLTDALALAEQAGQAEPFVAAIARLAAAFPRVQPLVKESLPAELDSVDVDCFGMTSSGRWLDSIEHRLFS
jgi:hypothetical protein